MAALIPIDPTWVTFITKPTDGDKRDAANVNIGFEGLAWRTDHLYANTLRSTDSIPANSGTFVFAGGLLLAGATSVRFIASSSRSYPRVMTGLPSRNPDSWWSEAEHELLTPRPAYKQRYSPVTPVAPWLVWRMRVPSEATITSVKVNISPASGHLGGLPDKQPILAIWKYNAANLGVMTAISAVQDNQATVGAYEIAHNIELTTSYTGFAAGDCLVIGVRGEEGNNALSASSYASEGLRVFHPIVTFNRPKLGEE